MSDAYYPPQQPFPFSSYPAQLSNPNSGMHKQQLGSQQAGQSSVGYLAQLQSQMHGVGQQGNGDMMGRLAGDNGMKHDVLRSMGVGADWSQPGPSSAYGGPPPPMALRNHARPRSNSHHSSEGSHSHSPPSQAMDEDAAGKVAGKRGRRKKVKEQDETDGESQRVPRASRTDLLSRSPELAIDDAEGSSLHERMQTLLLMLPTPQKPTRVPASAVEQPPYPRTKYVHPPSYLEDLFFTDRVAFVVLLCTETQAAEPGSPARIQGEEGEARPGFGGQGRGAGGADGFHARHAREVSRVCSLCAA